jgi:hypothetical protein
MNLDGDLVELICDAALRLIDEAKVVVDSVRPFDIQQVVPAQPLLQRYLRN